MNWLDCKKIYIDKLEDCTDLEAESLLMYLDRFPESKDLWLDQRTGEVFSKLQNYSNDPTSAFLTEPGMFTDSAVLIFCLQCNFPIIIPNIFQVFIVSIRGCLVRALFSMLTSFKFLSMDCFA